MDAEGGGFGKVLPWSDDMTRGFAPRKIYIITEDKYFAESSERRVHK
jgi:hypothetical protein